MGTPEKTLSIAEDNIAKLLNEQSEKLNAFLFDHTYDNDINVLVVKAFIAFSLAQHYALKAISGT